MSGSQQKIASGIGNRKNKLNNNVLIFYEMTKLFFFTKPMPDDYVKESNV